MNHTLAHAAHAGVRLGTPAPGTPGTPGTPGSLTGLIGFVSDNPFPSVCFAFAAGTAVYAAFVVARASAARAWPVARGVVTRSDIEWVDKPQHGSGVETAGVYMPRIEYVFSIGGTAYTGRGASFGGDNGCSVRAVAERKTDRYAVGDDVLVRYNPRRAAETCLCTRPESVPLLALIAAGTAAFGALNLLFG